jgi:hypothetical protein
LRGEGIKEVSSIKVGGGKGVRAGRGGRGGEGSRSRLILCLNS